MDCTREGNQVIKNNILAVLFMSAAGALLVIGCAEPPPDETADNVADSPAGEAAESVAEPDVPARDPRLDVFESLPELMDPVTLARVNLGRKLFYDPRLSKNQDISCNTCHVLESFGIDGLPTSTGHLGQVGRRNAPSVYNAAGHIAQFWDGRAANVEEQTRLTLLDPLQMAMPDEAAVEAVLQSIPGYAPMFAAAFPDKEQPITYGNTAKAIGAFERGLVTRSRFDDYLAGDDEALTVIEKEGLGAFLDAGCGSCHSGAYVGGSQYAKLGVVKPWLGTEDLGRFEVTGKQDDRQVFKVPSLRNVSHTGPYFHDGSVSSLNEAVRLMSDHQLGVELTNEQVISIIAFLNSLDGEIDPAYITMPELPESSDTTPAPDPV